MTTKPIFDHEKLLAYQFALEFASWIGQILERLPAKISARDQLDRASTSAVLNIAEGNGKSSLKDRKRFFEIFLGSAFECASCLDVLLVRHMISYEEMIKGKSILKRGINTLYGLIQNLERRIKA